MALGALAMIAVLRIVSGRKCLTIIGDVTITEAIGWDISHSVRERMSSQVAIASEDLPAGIALVRFVVRVSE